MKKALCLLLALLTVLATCNLFSIPTFSLDETVDYVQDGLFAWYKGDQNTRDGQNTGSNTWHDLIGGHDLPVNRDGSNYFTDEGFRVNGQKHYFPDEVLNLVNESYFTIEIEFGDFDPYGQDYNVFMNSSNDSFSLFRRVSENVIEWKYGGGNNRPKIGQSLQYLGGHLLTFTCEYGGPMVMYVDGVEMARTTCDLYMGADDLFIGQDNESRSYDALYKNIRFYSRPLATEEVERNACSLGYDPSQVPVLETHISIAQPVTNIVGDVAIVCPIGSQAQFDGMMAAEGNALPAVAVYEIDSQLRTLDASGAPFSTVETVMEESLYQILPCFSIGDRATADALASYLHGIGFYDVQIMSADKSVLKYARTCLPQCYGVLDLRADYASVTDLSTEQLLEIRRAVKVNNAYIAVLPVSLCRNEDVQYLYDRQVNVWAWATETPDAAEPYYALLSGAVGVVTRETDAYLDIACNQLAPNTLTRVPTNVGHRGVPALAPENTLEGSILAYEKGATVIEMDVYLSKDGHIVTMHDGTTGRTCNADISVEDSTLAELKALYANKGYENHKEYSTCRIPTLEEYFQWFKGKDCLFFIEIKSENPAIASALKELVEEYDIYDQCSVITFHESIMAAMREDYPEMSIGALSSIVMNSPSSDRDIPNVMSFIGPYNGTHNPYFGGYDGEDLRACMLRGISVYPWTFPGTINSLVEYFLYGYSGLTNNNAYLLKSVPRRMTCTEVASMQINHGMEHVHTVTSFDGSTEEMLVESIYLLEGNAQISYGSIIPLEVGEITYMTRRTFSQLARKNFSMYTQPVTVTVFDPNAETDTDAEIETIETPEPDTDQPTETTNPAETDENVMTEANESDPDSVVESDDQTTAEKPPISESPSEKGCHSTVSGSTCILTVLAAAIVCLTISRRRRI